MVHDKVQVRLDVVRFQCLDHPFAERQREAGVMVMAAKPWFNTASIAGNGVSVVLKIRLGFMPGYPWLLAQSLACVLSRYLARPGSAKP